VIVVEHEIVIHRPPEEVWRYLAEGFFEHVMDFNPDAVLAERIDGGPMRKGARGREAQVIQGKRREREVVVDAWEPLRVFALRNAAATSLETHYLSRWRLVPVAEGTRVEQRFELQWTMLLFRVLRPLIRRAIAKDLAAALGRIKAAVESG
jgi:hypothetical protein